MPHITIALDPAKGPLVKLVVGVSAARLQALHTASQPVPSPIVVTFLIDTGASSTVIDEIDLAPLGLVPKNHVPVHTPTTDGTPQMLAQYDVGLGMMHADNSRFFSSVPIIATNLRCQGIGGLLGRDILNKCLLVYDGATGTFTLAF